MKVKLPFCFILLIMTGAALADTKTLYYMGATWNDYCIGSDTGTLFKTPQQAQQTCGFKGYDLVGPDGYGNYGLAKNGTTWFSIYAKTQSCELKDIPGEGTNGAHNIGFRGDKAPKMMRRCINNCEVEDRRVSKYGESRDNDYGGAVCVELGSGEKLNCFADYTRIQTGTVCIPKPESKDDTKYDDVTDQPVDDNGNTGTDQTGTDGDGTKDKPDNLGQPPKQDGGDDSKSDGGGTGSDGSGNQSGGQGGTGADSSRDSGSADEPVEDKDKDKDKNKLGKGKGGGGGGNHGDKDKADDKAGDPKGGEGKGDGKGSDGKEGDKDGKDNQNGSPNGTDNGTGAGGDKDGKGSGISGGDCKTGKAPSCKGET